MENQILSLVLKTRISSLNFITHIGWVEFTTAKIENVKENKEWYVTLEQVQATRNIFKENSEAMRDSFKAYINDTLIKKYPRLEDIDDYLIHYLWKGSSFIVIEKILNSLHTFSERNKFRPIPILLPPDLQSKRDVDGCIFVNDSLLQDDIFDEIKENTNDLVTQTLAFSNVNAEDLMPKLYVGYKNERPYHMYTRLLQIQRKVRMTEYFHKKMVLFQDAEDPLTEEDRALYNKEIQSMLKRKANTIKQIEDKLLEQFGVPKLDKSTVC